MSATATSRRAEKPVIPPFWHRLPQVLAYPMNGESLMAIGLWTAAVTGCVVLSQTVGLLALLTIFAYCGFLRYCFSVLTRTARGHLTVEDAAGDIRFEADNRSTRRPSRL